MKRLLLLSAALCLAAPACADMELPSDEPVHAEEGGQLSLEWLIISDDAPISCVDAGASEVELAILGESELRERTSCYGGFAYVEGLESGAHLVEVSLVSPDGDRLVTAELGEVEIVAGATSPLGAVELSL